MKIANLNPDHDIGASAWFVEMDRHKLLMDAGIHPKREGREGLPLYGQIRGEELDAIAITHCHHDHVGSLPVAMQHFPKANVLMTELSYFIVERVLHNSVNVMQRQRDELGIREYPLFTHREVDEIAPLIQGFKYNREIEWQAFHKIRPGDRSPTLEFHDAGHALGSAGVMVRGEKETLFYTGDVCFHDQTILKGARFEDTQADVLIMETTRGNREVAPEFTREGEVNRLIEAIHAARESGGAILIPTFALGRTQEMLATLAVLMRDEKIRRQPIYIGGLGRVFTEIYDLQAHRTHRNLSSLQLREELDLQVLDRKQVETMKLNRGKLFVITAGMMSENTAAHDLAMRMVGDERQHIFFVGYADPSTPAGKLRASAKGETFHFSPAAGNLTHNCNLQEFDLTAHANRDELLDFVGRVSPRVVVLGHGDQDSRDWFEDRIRERYPKMQVKSPAPGESIEV